VRDGAPGEGRWWVYVLVSASLGRTYVGITIDVERRVAQHNGDVPGGARSTRAGRPGTLGSTYGPFVDRAEASRAEHAVKALRGEARLRWAP
jgi:putative endonuclease